jgi:hypothetical protein
MPAGGDSAGPYEGDFDIAAPGADLWAEPDATAGPGGAPADYMSAPPAEEGLEDRRAPANPRREIETLLATTQGADGSFGGKVDRTAAALVALVCLGHTRKKGTRRRVVEKAARWLSKHQKDALAQLALSLLERVEAGGDGPDAAEITPLLNSGPEGQALERALRL